MSDDDLEVALWDVLRVHKVTVDNAGLLVGDVLRLARAWAGGDGVGVTEARREAVKRARDDIGGPRPGIAQERYRVPSQG